MDIEHAFNLSNIVILLCRKYKLLLIHFILICVLAFIYAFFIAEKKFVSTIVFLPPFQEKSLMSLIPGGAFSTFSVDDIDPQQIVTLFESKMLKRKIINKFNLYSKYKLIDSDNKFELAVKRLKRELLLKTEEMGSFGVTKIVSFTMNTYHSSPDTCCLIVKYTYSILDSLIREISSDRGKRNRIFIESQYNQNKNILDSLQKTFRQFQIENKIYSMSGQVQLTLKNYEQLKMQFLTNEIRIKGFLQDFNEDYSLIQALKKENEVLEQKMKSVEKLASPDITIGLEKSAEIMPIYQNFVREIETQNKLIVLLKQQFEEAKLKELKDISTLQIVDLPYIPEYKAKPKRIFLLAGIIFVYMIFVFLILTMQYFFRTHIRKTNLYHEISKIFTPQ